MISLTAICFDFMPLDRFVRCCQRRNGALVQPKGYLRHGQHVTVPSGFAVPRWTDEETRGCITAAPPLAWADTPLFEIAPYQWSIRMRRAKARFVL
jgi:hypothetical protein